MARKTPRIIGLVLLAAAIAVGAFALKRRLAKRAAGNELVLYGNVDIRQVSLAFNGTQRIDKMLAVEGQTVEAGQLLGLLDTRRLEPMAEQARAQVQSQEQVLAALVAGSRPEEIRRARADVSASEADAIEAGILHDRTTIAYRQGAATDQELTDAKAKRDGAQARLKVARETLALAVAGPRKEDIAAAEATRRALQANLALLEQELADARLVAPSAAVVQVRVAEPGDMASPQKPAYTLALTDPVWVRVYVNESDLGKIAMGMTARVTTDSFPGKYYEGWVGFISPTAEFTPKTVETPELRTSLVYQVRIYVSNPQNELRLGMPATVTIPLGQHPTSIPAVPLGGFAPG
ncbi:MAG TPA: efflux RND transporter periplasmic adaptor subunit [Phycisphaerae bacterium]|nr:efflux RND transporter periplasmic adaptor subunit [Phycisphaerae bacterium]